MTTTINGSGQVLTDFETSGIARFLQTERTTSHTLSGGSENPYEPHMSISFTTYSWSNFIVFYAPSVGYESGSVRVRSLFSLSSTAQIPGLGMSSKGYFGSTFIVGRQTANNSMTGSQHVEFFLGLPPGNHRVTVNLMNAQSATTAITPYNWGALTRNNMQLMLFGV